MGDIIRIEKNQKIPADCIMLRTSEVNGSCFIRTDQLDGETDWKLRIAARSSQKLAHDNDLLKAKAHVYGTFF